MSLTSDQLTDMQGDLGISSDESVFTDAELNRLYTRASDNYELAVFYAFRQLMADAAKFHDYRLANSEMKLSQVRKNLEAQADYWKEEARSSGNQVRIVGGLRIPPKRPDLPDDLRRNLDTDRYEYDNAGRKRTIYDVNRGI